MTVRQRLFVGIYSPDVRRLIAAAWCAAFVCQLRAAGATPTPTTPWIFVSDIHYDPTSRDPAPSVSGMDTDLALLRSTVTEMKRVDPAAPVIVINGDFLGHHFNSSRAEETMKSLARVFDAAFPGAQFVIALGNEESGCGDYQLSENAPFLRSVAVAWGPLVNRHGAAPEFARTFVRDGFYVAALPRANLEAIVIDDVFWSPRYHAGCGGRSAADATMLDLRRALLQRSRNRKWLLLHIPPGVDAYSTMHVVHHLIDVPFLDPRPRDQLLSLLRDQGARVAVVLAAHTHKFAFRIVGDSHRSVPMLLVPSVSPIFANSPAFLIVDVDRGGTITRVEDHAFVAWHWQAIGSTQSLGLREVTGLSLLGLQARLARDSLLRERFARLYDGNAPPEINERNWRGYWCAATSFASSEYRACIGGGAGLSVLTDRGLAVLIAGSIMAVALLIAAILMWRRQRSRRANAADKSTETRAT